MRLRARVRLRLRAHACARGERRRSATATVVGVRSGAFHRIAVLDPQAPVVAVAAYCGVVLLLLLRQRIAVLDPQANLLLLLSLLL